MKILFLTLILFITIFQLSLQTYIQTQKLYVDIINGYYGYSVALNGNKLLVGDTGIIAFRGNAYLYQRNGTLYETKTIINSPYSPYDSSFYQYFGTSVIMEGNTLAISAPGEDTNRGSVYIYDCSGMNCNVFQRLIASDGLSYNYFGLAMSFSGNMLAISAYGKNDDSGAVYIFTFNGSAWVQQYEILSPFAKGGRFGYSLALFNNTLVVGAPYNASGPGYAAVYIITETNFSFLQNLTNDVVNNGEFGNAVAFDGNTMVVSAFWNTIGKVSQVGSVYVYVKSGDLWTLQEKLYPQEYSPGFQFGIAVAIYENILAVGSGFEKTVFIYNRSELSSKWTLSQSVTSSDYPTHNVEFGATIALNANTLVVGDPLYNPTPGETTFRGAVYIFEPTSESQTTGIVCGAKH